MNDPMHDELEVLRRRVVELEMENRRLRDTRALLHDLVQQAPFSIQVLDANGRVIEINAAHERLIGLSRDAYFARMTEDFRAYIRRSMPSAAAALDRAFAGETVEMPPFRYQAVVGPHGTSSPLSDQLARGIWLATRAFPVVGEGGRVTYVVLINEDVSARVRLEQERAASERRYRLLVESLDDAVVVFDEQRVITMWNRAAERIYGWKAAEVIGRASQEVLATETDEGTPDTIMGRIVREGAWHGTLHQRTRDDRVIEVESAASYVPRLEAPDEERGVVVCVNRDVTEHRRLQAQLVHAQKMESVGTLAGGIAHEFNNMLAGILGYASLLARQPLEPDVRRAVRIIQESASRGARLTQQLLTFARKQDVARVILDLNACVETSVAFLSQIIGKSVDVALDLAPTVRSVRGDQSQVEQVLVNLALNARDSMPSGGTIRIATSGVRLPAAGAPPGLPGGDYVRLSVEDTGVGMDAAVLARVFEPFFTTKETGAGTGLGLAVVYGIVQEHGGAIVGHSEPGVGTRFDVYLPAVEGAVAGPMKGSVLDLPGGDAMVLVVDDEPTVREMAAEMLRALGYQTTTAADGAAAVARVQALGASLDLVLLDLVMPGMDGLETFRAIREVRPDARVVLSTGLNRDQLAREVLEEGAAGFVGKPYDLRQLAVAIYEALHRA